MPFLPACLLRILGFVSCVALFTACHWDDIGASDDPGTATLPVTAYLLTNAQAGLLQIDYRSGLYCQYYTLVEQTGFALYENTTRGWSGEYAGPLFDLETIIKLNADPATRDRVLASGSNNNQIAAARILKAYFIARLTDNFGDVPYSEALKGNTHPKYDLQQDIYKDLFKELKEAVSQFDGGPTPAGDVLWSGRTDAWKKFANSLRLILALRISKADPQLAAAECIDALHTDSGVIEDPADAAILISDGLSSYINPWNGDGSSAISETIVDLMNNLGADPRLSCFGQPNNQGEVIGVPYGLNDDSAFVFTTAHPDWSHLLRSDWQLTISPFFVLTPAQVYLARAEAAQRDWTDEDPVALYQAGIQASWEQWQVFDPNAFESYMNKPGVSLATGDALQKIGIQRWIAYFPDGFQGWCEWRRTGFPALLPTPWALNESRQIPRRYSYPESEQNLNRDAWEAAVARMGGRDVDHARIWWDAL